MKEITVTVFDNGMVIVWDHNGQQIPHLQGRKEEAAKKIAAWVEAN